MKARTSLGALLLAIGLVACAYALWLAIELARWRLVGTATDDGPGLFLLAYGALPIAVILLVGGWLMIGARSPAAATALAGFTSAVAVVDVAWFIGLRGSISGSPIAIAAAATVLVTIAAGAVLLRTMRLRQPRHSVTGAH